MTAVDVGKSNDGLLSVPSGGTPLDRDFYALLAEFNDAREAFQKNPLARRIIGLTTAYVVGGQGITIKANRRGVSRFLAEFEAKNRLNLRQADWCEELARSGELFISLHMAADGIPAVRAKPASQIKEIVWQEGDYETELEYVESGELGIDGRRWQSPTAAQRGTAPESGASAAIMCHYAVNRPVGCLRGQSDLASILPWLRRYSRWLDDRVRMNAAMRAFLWIVRTTAGNVQTAAARYATPPESGSVLVIDRDKEEWIAVTPDLQANDAERDGRAIRWMIAAGGPGIGLTDLGEAETANLATAEAMGEQRRRFLRQRQLYFSWALADLIVTAYNWSVAGGRWRGPAIAHADLDVTLPDLSPADNQALAGASQQIAGAFAQLRDIVGDTPTLRRLASEMTIKFAGETLSDEQLKELSNVPQTATDRPQ